MEPSINDVTSKGRGGSLPKGDTSIQPYVLSKKGDKGEGDQILPKWR